ncbi:hypothetical protein GCM10009569_08790 [Arthrobacter russicus]
MVVEEPEQLVDPHIDARRLHHRGLERVKDDSPGVDLGSDVAVRDQHNYKLAYLAGTD